MVLPGGPYLTDTGILLRLDQPNSPITALKTSVIQRISDAGDDIIIAPQNLIEFWNVATRATANNGFGFTPTQALARIRALQNQFSLLPDTPDIYPKWEQSVEMAQVSGKQVHDTRLVAFMVVHRIPNLLTLNGSDFRRFETLANITVVEPQAPVYCYLSRQ